MVDKVALAKKGLKFAVGRQSKKSKKGDKVKTPKVLQRLCLPLANALTSSQPGDNPFYYVDVVQDRYGQPKLDGRGRPVTKECRKDLDYYVRKLGIPEEDAKILLKMKSRAMLMDGGRKVLGMRIPLGLSTVLTFCIPEIGDGVDGMISYIMVVRAGKISGGLGARNHAAMTLNVGRDFAIGAIPFAGAIIDMFYRANTRNSNMLEKILIERVKKAQLHPNASYESSLREGSPDSQDRFERNPPPQLRDKQHDRAHTQRASEPTHTKRANTAPSKGNVHKPRGEYDFNDPNAPLSSRGNSKKSETGARDGGRSYTDLDQDRYASRDPRRDRAQESSGRHGGRFVSAKDL